MGRASPPTLLPSGWLATRRPTPYPPTLNAPMLPYMYMYLPPGVPNPVCAVLPSVLLRHARAKRAHMSIDIAAVALTIVVCLVGVRWLLRSGSDEVKRSDTAQASDTSEALELLEAAKKTAAALLDEAERQADDIIRCARVEAASIIEHAHIEVQQHEMSMASKDASYDQPQLALITCLLDTHAKSGSDWQLAAFLAQLNRAWNAVVSEWRRDMTTYVWRETGRTNGITEEELMLVGRSCPLLTQLDISRCFSVSNAALLATIEGCPDLRCLNVSCVESKLTDDFLFKLAERCPQLTALDLTYCSFGEAGLKAVAAGCPQLRTVLLNACHRRGGESVTDPFVIALAGNCPQLTELDLSQCRALTDRALLALSQSCTQLQTLKLHGNGPCTHTGGGIYDAGVIAVACPSITKLDLNSCKITDAAVFAIAHNCPLLTDLDIGGIRLQEEEKISCNAILTLARACPALQALRMYQNRNVDDNAAAVLAPALSNLRHLCLNGCEVGDQGMEAILRHCSRLTFLDLCNAMKITDNTIQMVANRLPDLQMLILVCNYRLTTACQSPLAELAANGCSLRGEWPGNQREE